MPSPLQYISQQLKDSSDTKLALAEKAQAILDIGQQLVSVVKNGGTIFACGNGGSACDAMHLTEELVARYKRDRPGIKAQHFCDPSTITCWANDFNFDDVYARQVDTLVSDKDAVIVFSTSGNSENILRALAKANDKGAKTIAMLGKTGGKAKSLAKTSLIIERNETARIQEAHITVVHILCEYLEDTLFPVE